MTFKTLAACAAAMAASFAATAALASDPIPYPNGGTENPVSYTFTAVADGDLMALFGGSGAAFDEQLGLLVNGMDTGITGLDNHTSAVGQALDFGNVHAGDSLIFYIVVNDGLPGEPFTYYSKTSMNDDGQNHAYAAHFDGLPAMGIPAGTYVGFEDLSVKHDGFSDFNYQDEQFLFTNTAAVASGTPEPATWAMMLIGFGGLGAALRRRRAGLLTA